LAEPIELLFVGLPAVSSAATAAAVSFPEASQNSEMSGDVFRLCSGKVKIQ
jgi:hypothetical protein